MIKRIVSVCFVMLMLLSLCAPAFSAYVLPVADAVLEDSVKLNWFSKENWQEVSGIDGLHIRSTGSSHIIYVTSDDDKGVMKIAYAPKKPLDFSEYNELALQFTLSNGDNCNFEVTYYYEGGTFSEKATNESGARKIVYFALPSKGKNAIEKIEISVENAENMLNYFAIEEIYADKDRTYSYAERFSSRSVVAVDGNAVYTDNYVEITPDENGAHIECSLIEDHNNVVAMAVAEVYSPNAGIMTVENESAGTIQTTALYSGTAKYSFMISGLGERIKIGFSESDISLSAPIRFISLKIIKVSENEPVTFGNIESCIYENGKISVKGTIDPDAAVKYIKSKLELYKVPYDYSGEGELPEPEAEMDISTVFELVADADYDHTQYRYLVAIKTKTETIPLATPVFAFSHASLAALGQDCRVGIHNVGTTAVFESEADDVVIDVDMSKLFAASNTGSVIRFAYRENAYYFDSEYVNELSSNINFFASTGAKVYLQLKTAGEDVIAISVDDKASVDMMCASAAYIGESFDKITGVIVFDDFNYAKESAEGANEISVLLGLFSSSFRSTNKKAEIILPADSSSSYTAPLIAYFNRMYGINDIGLMYKCSDASNCISGIRAVLDASSVFSGAFRRTLVLWKTGSIIPDASTFAALYDNAAKSGITGIVFSSNGSISTDTICEYFSGIHGEGYVSHEFDTMAEAPKYRGEYSLWNFTDAYNTFGWIAGGNCSEPETVRSFFGEGRVMRTVVTPSRGEEGILVCWLEGATDLSVADAMKMDFYIDANTGEAMPVTIVLGGKGMKAEYKSQVYYGENTVYADLELFPEANRIEYVAVIVDIDKEATVEISEISVVSSQLAGMELKAELSPDDGDNKDMASLYIFAGTIISATIVIFAVLSKKSGIKQNSSK